MTNYSFCKFQIPEETNKVIWEITNKCNYSCEYCIFSSTGRKPKGELSLTKIKETLVELKVKGFNYIKFTGGEPFIHNDFINILKYAQILDFNYDISTNASYITEEISQQLSQLKINFIHVSLDGHNKQTHDFVRGKNSFNKTTKGLLNLLKYNNNIRLGTVIHSENEIYLQEIVDYANNLNIKEIIFSIMAPIGKLTNQTNHLTTKTPEEIIQQITSLTTNLTTIKHNINSDLKTIKFSNPASNFCPGGDKFLFINSIGIVSPCTWISDQHPEFHHMSLQEHSLKDILNHHTFIHFNEEKTKLNNQCFAFSYKANNHFNKIYSFSTENIHFINQLPIKNNLRALTITGSGDQTLQLISNNFKYIDCIDINPLSNYFAELKIAALKSFSFTEFIFFFKNNEQSLDFQQYKKIRQLLSSECEMFWNNQYLINQHQGLLIRNSKIFNLVNDDWDNKLHNVPYLSSKETYEQIQFNVLSTKIKFITDNFQSFNNNKKYDLILLSNIADYSHKMFLGDYIQQYKENIILPSIKKLTSQGLLMFAYIYDYENINNSEQRNKINSKEIRKRYFNDLSYSEFLINSAILKLKNDVVCYLQKD